ncbi:MAG: hypothetical protein AB2699_00255, partial [Candidatus Thiodiazotropha taylori]
MQEAAKQLEAFQIPFEMT